MRLIRFPSRIGRRLFAFNLLVVFIPVAGTWYLDVYESKLLETQERGMIQQARGLAAALAVSDLRTEQVAALLAAIDDRGETRVRVYDWQGRMLDDTSRLAAREPARTSEPYSQVTDTRRRILYRLGALLVRVRAAAGSMARRLLVRHGPISDGAGSAASVPPEVRVALSGRYGAASRPTPGQRSMTLHAAVPVQHDGRVVGAVVVSQSTFRILQALYEVRLRLFQIVLLALLCAALLTFLAAATIVNPIVRLQQAAAALTSRRRELGGFFSSVDRKDEIGDLALSLEHLARRLEVHIKAGENFAADVAHEFRNPLAAIRTAAETIAESETEEERERFLKLLLRDVDRLDRLVAGVRDMAHVDAQISSEPRQITDIRPILTRFATRSTSATAVEIAVDVDRAPLAVNASADRLRQVFENLIDNAASFAPPGSRVDLRGTVEGREVIVAIADRGPGIPDAHLPQIFDRFFSYRPATDRRAHMGLGLAIARAVVEGHGGRITAHNREGGGAEFRITLPAASSEEAVRARP